MKEVAKRALLEEDRPMCRDILGEYGVEDTKRDECLDKLAPYMGKSEAKADDTKEEQAQEGHLSKLRKILGCSDDASLADICEAAQNVKDLYSLRSTQTDEDEDDKEKRLFDANEAKGLHRKMGKDLAKRLFEKNRGLYDEEVKKIKPLQRASPTQPANLDRISVAGNQAEQFQQEAQREIEKSPSLNYSQAYDIVARRWEAQGKGVPT